ncbi:Zinc finger protein var3 protein [Thalictrum thalictroides]|uniref:Zinc finger protein var3 protein n=1 Tax=Thalictrum thalictroides TaxID=46969 RepID=A0A7J6WPE9_THATH|nr:Zinc finger protein var3 protein [Thalictrum thalictroides]
MVRLLPIPMASSSLHLPCFSSLLFSSSLPSFSSRSTLLTLSSYNPSRTLTFFHLATVIPRAQIFGVRASNFVKSEGYNTQTGFSINNTNNHIEGYGQTSTPLRQNIEMKRGDWICPKCTFMNFARNMNCLECDETRPKRQLTGGEWECPNCDFFNYGKNGVCLRCDCIRPAEASGTANTRFGLEYNNDTQANTWNTRTTSLERETTSAQYQRTSPEGNVYRSIDGVVPGKSSSTSISQNLDKILGRTSEESKSGYVPFKPLPSDMFAKSQKSKLEEQLTSNAAAEANELMSSRNSDSLPLSRKPVNQIESKEDKVQAEKSERWFNKVAELHDVTDLASAISDEDFPEIMPMRKGENRFVVSKKKDRSLTSPAQKRRMAMEQTNNSNNFVPFVPFPPDYFAKKDKVPETEASAGQDASNTSASAIPEMQALQENLAEPETFMNSIHSGENQQQSNEKCDTSYSGKFTESRVNHSYGRSTGKSAESSDSLQPHGRESWSGGSWDDNRSSLLRSTGNSTQQSENADNRKESWKGGFSGKSLEGSLVQEPDPLDMSEEAKAQRWFKRASQIKDISELSQIPDEDFPQIMPMRKGVNRFVVSKRKTPLERRLTSPQYRRNLPIISSDPIKKDNSES